MGLINTNSPFLCNIEYESLGSAEQSYIVSLIDLASDHLEKQCRRKFEEQTFTEIKDGDGSTTILVKNPPIISLTEITFYYDGSTETFDSSYFLIEDLAGIIHWNPRLDGCIGYFPKGVQNIQIEYVGGFEDIPRIAQFLVAEMVIEAFAKDAGVNNVQKEKLGQYFIDYGPKSFDRVLLNKQQMLHSLRVKNL